MSDNGDNSLAGMLMADGVLELDEPQPDWKALYEIVVQAKQLSSEGRFDKAALDAAMEKLKLAIPPDHADDLVPDYEEDLRQLLNE